VITATRFHDFSAGHRVTGHESKCAHLHGHNYRVHFTVTADHLDKVGRVVDFSVINSVLCLWLERNWDHKFLIWEEDPQAEQLYRLDPEGVVLLTFNPTAENMAKFLLTVIGPLKLAEEFDYLVLTRVVIEETRKCSVGAELEPNQE
jgi:6-pyruvoyltetrahydropterin/6-carboxytetrahydropterin synthase